MADLSLLARLRRRLTRGREPGTAGDPDRAGEIGRPEERSRVVSGPNGPVSVVEQGSGPVILIVHGGSGDLTAWSAVADRLARRFRVLRYTRPTYRLIPPPRGAEAAEAEVVDALAVAADADEPVLLVGHSSGAVVALQAALADPERFAGLALYEPPLDVTHTPEAAEALGRARAAIDAGRPAEAMRVHLRDFVGLPGRLVWLVSLLPPPRQLLLRYAAGQIADNEMLDSLPAGLERYRELRPPVLLITGQTSPGHLRQRSSDLAAVLPDVAGQVELPGQGHGANTGDSGALATAIRRFADRLG